MKNNGFLPISILEGTILQWLKDIDEKLSNELSNAATFDDLNKAIKYKCECIPGIEPSEITPNHTIVFYEKNFQYIWCVSFYLYVFYQEGIIKKIENGTYQGVIDANDNEYMRSAIEVIKAGDSLNRNFRPGLFYGLPNPEYPTEKYKNYIGVANGICTAAVLFNFLHEYAHHYYRHVDYIPTTSKQSKEEEFLADQLAIEKLQHFLNDERKDTIQLGVIVGLASIIFLNKSFDGGDKHPNNDERLEHCMQEMNIEPNDPFWVIATFVLLIGAKRMKLNIKAQENSESFKEQFNELKQSINNRLK